MRDFIKQIWNTKGLARWIFLTGLVITVAVRSLRDLRALDRAVRLRPDPGRRRREVPPLQPPSGELLLARRRDQFYDIWSRVISGARTAVEVVVLSVVISALIGVPLGMVSGSWAARSTASWCS